MRKFLFYGYTVALLAIFTGIWYFDDAQSEETKSDEATTPIISNIIIQIQNVEGNETHWRDLAKKLIFLKPETPFSTEQLKNSIEALTLSKKFEKIHVDSKDEDEKIAIIFLLKPFQYIKDIKIDGAFPLFEREILNAMTFYAGDAYIKEQLPKQEKLITELFLRQGFINPKVKVRAHQDPEDGYYIINVNINRGPYYLLRNIEIQGNQSFSEKRLKLRMKIWISSLLPGGSGRFVEESLKKDIKNLTEYYRKKGYADIAITYTSDKKNSSESSLKKKESAKKDISLPFYQGKNQAVSVLITIDEGPIYEIKFSGNEEFWGLTLKKELVLFEEGNKYDSGIKKSIKKIKERYRSAGYLDTEVTIEDKISPIASTPQHGNGKERQIRKLCFVIKEGIQSIVKSIQITGNHAFDQEKIEKQILTRLPGTLNKGAFVPEVLQEDLNAIRALYLKNGYMNTQVKEEVTWHQDKKEVAVSIIIDEGVQTLVSSVKITGIKVISETEAFQTILLNKGEPYREHMIQRDENELAALISEKGYPHVKVKGDVSVSPDQKGADVIYHVEEGPYVEMGQIYYTGNFRTKEKIIKNEVEVKPEEPFSLKKMLETQKNIRDIDAFDSVQFKAIGLKEKAEEVNLFVEIEETKPYFIEMGAGYDTERHFYTHAKAGDHNLFGANKDAWVGGEISEIGFRTDLGVTEPRLLSSRISSTLELFAEQREELNQDFGTRTYGASLGFHRQWFKPLFTSLNFGFNRREQFERDADPDKITTTSNEEYEARTIFTITPSVRYDTRDSFVRPRKGSYTAFSVDISKGLENSLDNFLKYRFDARYFWTPLERLTFACYGNIGYIDPFDSDGKVPEDQLFFLGGTSDVRGFAENLLRYDANGKPQGGKSAISGSLEARFDLGLNFELTGFYDVGKVDNLIGENDDFGEFRSTVGLGLRYITPIGPIGFLYGIKLDRHEGESYGRLHFSLGYTF